MNNQNGTAAEGTVREFTSRFEINELPGHDERLQDTRIQITMARSSALLLVEAIDRLRGFTDEIVEDNEHILSNVFNKVISSTADYRDDNLKTLAFYSHLTTALVKSREIFLQLHGAFNEHRF